MSKLVIAIFEKNQLGVKRLNQPWNAKYVIAHLLHGLRSHELKSLLTIACFFLNESGVCLKCAYMATISTAAACLGYEGMPICLLKLAQV